MWDCLVKHDAQQRVEVRVPDIPAHIKRGGHGVREDYSAVLEQWPWDKRNGCAPLFPQAEGDNEQQAKDKEANDHRRLPLLLLKRVQVEGKEEECETCREDEYANDVELFEIVKDSLVKRAATRPVLDQSLSTGFGFVDEEHGDEWGAYDRCDDGEDAVAPSPAYAAGCDDAIDRVPIDPGGDEEWRGSIGDEEASILELGCVGDKDSH